MSVVPPRQLTVKHAFETGTVHLWADLEIRYSIYQSILPSISLSELYNDRISFPDTPYFKPQLKRNLIIITCFFCFLFFFLADFLHSKRLLFSAICIFICIHLRVQNPDF